MYSNESRRFSSLIAHLKTSARMHETETETQREFPCLQNKGDIVFPKTCPLYLPTAYRTTPLRNEEMLIPILWVRKLRLMALTKGT